MRSRVFRGETVHCRHTPERRVFRYRMFWLAIDLDELSELDRVVAGFGYNRRATASVADRDYGGSGDGSVREKIHAVVERDGSIGDVDRITLVTIPRIAGYVFNPVSFFILRRGDEIVGLVAEVRNTFGEQHHYVAPVDAIGTGGVVARFAKTFFVSPFLERSGAYEIRVREEGERLHVGVDLREAGQVVFAATMDGVGRPMTSRSLAGTLARMPLFAATIMLRIQWQALLLYAFRRLRVYAKPTPLAATTSSPSRFDRMRRAISGRAARRSTLGSVPEAQIRPAHDHCPSLCVAGACCIQRIELRSVVLTHDQASRPGRIWTSGTEPASHDHDPGTERVMTTVDATVFQSAAIETAFPPEIVIDDAVICRFHREGIYGLGEMYLDGLWTSDRLDDVMHAIFTAPPIRLSPTAWTKMLGMTLVQRFVNRQAGRRAFNIGVEHYDLGNDLFSRMLDASLSYTSGYWADARTLEAAQEAKLDLICRKLDLKPGQRVLDIGCGWGNFARYAAERYGARVTGLTVSKEQAALARSRCEGLPVEIRLQDYREVDGVFDHIVSIEMIEAVGRKNLPTFFGVVDRCLADGGSFAMQVIYGDMFSRTSDRRLDQYMVWLLKYIFPDGYLPRQEELIPPSSTSLRVQDWHRYHDDYERTLLEWRSRFEATWDEIAPQYDERFRRRWQFYLSGCAAAFRAGLVDVGQVVYTKGSRSRRAAAVR